MRKQDQHEVAQPKQRFIEIIYLPTLQMSSSMVLDASRVQYTDNYSHIAI
jgi:hypothetical protein